MDKFYKLMKDGTLYQFLILIALILWQCVYMIMNGGNPSGEILAGIFAVMVGVPVLNGTDKRGNKNE